MRRAPLLAIVAACLLALLGATVAAFFTWEDPVILPVGIVASLLVTGVVAGVLSKSSNDEHQRSSEKI